MKNAPPLLVSIPSIELNRLKLRGTVFDARRLLNAPLSRSLLRAVEVVLEQLAPRHGDVRCVARPEMFTHGEALAWLRQEASGATRHVCLSNGQTLKLLPGFQNEMFVYGLHREAGFRQYRDVLRRAPELLAGFDIQYNTAHRTETEGKIHVPRVVPLVATKALTSPDICWYYPFYLNRHSHADSAERMLKWGTHEAPLAGQFQRFVIVDCSETALLDALFCHALAALVARAAHDPSICVLLHMPDPEDPTTEMSARMRRILEGVHRGKTSISRVRIDNVILCTAIDEAELLSLRIPFELVLHEYSPLWGFHRKLLPVAESVQFYSARESLSVKSETSTLQRSLLARTPVEHQWTTAFASHVGPAI